MVTLNVVGKFLPNYQINMNRRGKKNEKTHCFSYVIVFYSVGVAFYLFNMCGYILPTGGTAKAVKAVIF
jgi:hypothetical protein